MSKQKSQGKIIETFTCFGFIECVQYLTANQIRHQHGNFFVLHYESFCLLLGSFYFTEIGIVEISLKQEGSGIMT